jgi:hypothetical protein
MGSDATAFQASSEATFRDAAKIIPERSTVSESWRTVATVSPTESEIATVAYRLWLDNGCPIGSDREDWFRAEAMLKSALVARCGALSRRPPTPRRDPRTESEVLVAFRWGLHGHWEVWEMEWGGARWIYDDATPGAGSNRAGRRNLLGTQADRPAIAC